MSGGGDYRVFGLHVRSEFMLPELLPADEVAVPDVRITTGPVAAPNDDEEGLHTLNGSLVLVVPEVARFLVQGGNSIIVDAAAGVPERNIRLYLLGSAFGAILHQRGLLPLHANAVDIDGHAVGFMGASGEGKSTLAAWFHDEGYRVIADDILVVKPEDDGRAYALQGLARLRLWQDALEASGREAHHYQRSYADEEWNKFDVPIERAGDAADIELRALYDLRRGDAFKVEPLSGLEAAEAVFANTYRGSYVSAAKGELNHWQSCVRLVRNTPVFRLSRPSDLGRMSETFERILDHVRAQYNIERAGRS
jgi:hypothetical protein